MTPEMGVYGSEEIYLLAEGISLLVIALLTIGFTHHEVQRHHGIAAGVGE